MKKTAEYVAGMTVPEYLGHMRSISPRYADTLWFDRPDAARIIAGMDTSPPDFEDEEDGGRAVSYQESQLDPTVRRVGIVALTKLLVGPNDVSTFSKDRPKLLDLLGGDGTLERCWRALHGSEEGGDSLFLTSDLSAAMVTRALRHYRLPAVRQPAQELLIRDASLDGVVAAYGTHHIPEHERLLVAREASRVLRPMGRFALHDFGVDSPHARWFQDVVHPYSSTGHKYSHFTPDEIFDYLRTAGFDNVQISNMYDPF